MERKKTKQKTETKGAKVTAQRKRGRGRPSKKEMIYIDGKTEAPDELSQGIEEILYSPKNPFGTNSIEELEGKMDNMSLRQMQELAVKASVFPSGNKTSLKNKIKKEFSNRFGTKDSKKVYNNSVEKPIVEPTSQLAKDIMDILNER